MLRKMVMRPLSGDFSKFWFGQTVSSVGDSFSLFILPLLVFKLTGSVLNLALTSAISMLPYLLFGLVIGVWVDRLDRKRLMIVVDLLRTVTTALIPLLAMLGWLSVWWIYSLALTNATLSIFFDASQFAAIARLADPADLVKANGRIQASYSAATIIGPLVAGMLIAFISLPTLLLLDSFSFLISAISLSLIKTSFNATNTSTKAPRSIRADIQEGLSYIVQHPILRNISLMMALVNLFSSSVGAQLIFLSQSRTGADDSQISWLYSAGSVVVMLLAFTAGWLRKRFSFGQLALAALTANGLVIIAMSFTTVYWLLLPLWGLYSGLILLFNINTASLRQSIVPNHLLGRVVTGAKVLAWSVMPLGSSVGGWITEQTQHVELVYFVIGLIVVTISIVFRFTALGRTPQLQGRHQPLILEEIRDQRSEIRKEIRPAAKG